MRRNETKDFVGIDRLKARHAAQVDYMKGILSTYFHSRIHLMMKYALDSSGVIYDPTCRPKDFYLSVLDTIEKACDGIVSKISGM